MTEQENQTSEEQTTSTGNSSSTNASGGSVSNRDNDRGNSRGGSQAKNSRSRNAQDFDGDDDYNDEYDYDDYEDEGQESADGDDEIREIRTSGPNDYVPSTQRGRSRRINLDIKLEELHYKNIPLLTRFLDPRGRILSRRKTGVSAKIQRRAVTAIKQARHLALLPFTAEQTRVTRLRRRSR